MIDPEFLEGGEVLVEFTPGEDRVITPWGSSSLLGKAIPIGLEIPFGSGRIALVLVLEWGGGGAPPEGFLWEGLQSHSAGGGSVLWSRRNASGKKGEYG